MAASLRGAARMSPLLCVTGRALLDLAAELGGVDAAAAFLLAVAEEVGRPVAANVPTGPDTSSTAFVSPPGWTGERLAGWVAGHHAELAAEFGEVVRVGCAGIERSGT